MTGHCGDHGIMLDVGYGAVAALGGFALRAFQGAIGHACAEIKKAKQSHGVSRPNPLAGIGMKPCTRSCRGGRLVSRFIGPRESIAPSAEAGSARP